MLVIRLARIGKKHKPSYRIIISEKHKDTKGDYLEKLGFYNPTSKPKVIQLNKERIKYWLSHGAQVAPTIYNFLVDEKVVFGPKKKANTIKRKKEEAKKEEISKETLKMPAEPIKEIKQMEPVEKTEKIEGTKSPEKSEEPSQAPKESVQPVEEKSRE